MTDRSRFKHDATLYLGDVLPRVEGHDFTGRPGHIGESITVTVGDGPVSDLRVRGTRAQHRAFIAAYAGQIDKVETAHALAVEEAETTDDGLMPGTAAHTFVHAGHPPAQQTTEAEVDELTIEALAERTGVPAARISQALAAWDAATAEADDETEVPAS